MGVNTIGDNGVLREGLYNIFLTSTKPIHIGEFDEEGFSHERVYEPRKEEYEIEKLVYQQCFPDARFKNHFDRS